MFMKNGNNFQTGDTSCEQTSLAYNYKALEQRFTANI